MILTAGACAKLHPHPHQMTIVSLGNGENKIVGRRPW